MDLHMLIVIVCVFLVSFFSLLFINKFFHGKTFEEAAAEKKLLAEKLYGPKVKRQRVTTTNKKDAKKQKKQNKQKDGKDVKEIQNVATGEDAHDSDVQTDNQSEESGPSPKKPHVEFLEPEIIAEESVPDGNVQRRSSNASGSSTTKQVKRKISNSSNKPTWTAAPTTGILVNKTEPVIVKETLTTESLNNFEVKQPKDVVELKKQAKDSENIETKKDKEKTLNYNSNSNSNNSNKDVKKLNKQSKKDQEKLIENISNSAHHPELVDEISPPVIKEVKKVDEKSIKTTNSGSPKTQNLSKSKKKKSELSAFAPGLGKSGIPLSLDNSDVLGVNMLMNLFSRAELNRNEIQILIDYLLNKQQDTLANHSEWSDDVMQKLRKQLNEKEKALKEAQEASYGLQAKLRDLRAEVNSERANFNATFKAYAEDIKNKQSDIQSLKEEIQNLNIDRQQLQAKLHHEQQAGSQELARFQQLNEHNNLLQNEIVQKNSLINELQKIVQNSRQAVEDSKVQMNEIIQQQVNQIRALEQNLNEAEKKIACQQYELDVKKVADKEKEVNKVEILNLQNALDSSQAELNLARSELTESKNAVKNFTVHIEELSKQISAFNSKIAEQTRETEELKNTIANLKATITEKDEKLKEFDSSMRNIILKESELQKQIQEQKEKNNDLREKNWKLVEALKKAEDETTNSKANKEPSMSNVVIQTNSPASMNDEKKIRELFQRLCPEATKANSNLALSLSLDQWIEKVVSAHVRQMLENQQQQNSKYVCEKSSFNELNNTSNSSNNHNNHIPISTHTQTTNNNNHFPSHSSPPSNKNNEETSNGDNSKLSCSSFTEDNDNNSTDNEPSREILLQQNGQLRTHIEELTSIVTKTENMLRNLETQALEQDAHWRDIVQSKQEEINLLKNGQAI